jgi:hypothetical protein
MSVAEMGISLFAVDRGYLDDVPLNKIGDFEAGFAGVCAGQPYALDRPDQRGGRLQRRDRKRHQEESWKISSPLRLNGGSMAGAKEIRTKIKSIKSTQKITKAMEMVAASKMRKAQERMRAARPYATKIRNVISHLAHAHTEYRSPGLIEREVKRVGLIVISTDRGLCGGLNTNLFKTTILAMQQWRNSDIEIDICTVGTKAFQFFRR